MIGNIILNEENHLNIKPLISSENYYSNYLVLKNKYHNQCLFNQDKYQSDDYFKEDGTYVYHFFCTVKHQGYAGMIHGGVLSALVDSAMARCLFGHGIKAYTVRLNIKFLKPVKINHPITVVAKIKDKNEDTVIPLQAFIIQNDRKIVIADAQFWVIENLLNKT
ncbi:MAG: PaaI family thioesterase [Spirochaetes bacterium]|nr:PaaI family thioesterase [Spirochaetota bacterium]